MSTIQIDRLLDTVIREDASDIHIETFERRLVVRMRVDGVLREVLSTSPALAPLVASRIKVISASDLKSRIS